MKKFCILVFVLTVLILLLSGSQVLAVSSDCTKCHGGVVSTFNVLPPVPEQACIACHNHYAIDERHTRPSWTAVYVSGTGYFKSSSSIQTKPPEIHTLHNGRNLPAGSNSCRKCHSATNCETCHVPVDHRIHSSTENDDFPVYRVAYGTGYDLNAITCTTSTCHNYYIPGVVTQNSDGTQLCLNCHSTDKSGHTQANLDSLHGSTTSALPASDAVYNVTCTGCHDSSLADEHKKVAAKLSQPEDAECGYCHMSTAQEAVKNTVYAIIAVNAKQMDTTIKTQNLPCG